MKALVNRIYTAVSSGEKVVVCTVLASSGSAPRGAGARMAVFQDGTTLGTVGGGRVEFLAAQEAGEILQSGKPCLRAFDLQPEQVNSIGMICGGKVTIYYQLLTQAELPLLRQMREVLLQEENTWLYLSISDGIVRDCHVVDAAAAAAEPTLFTSRAVLQKGEPLIYCEPLTQAGSVYIFGGGHVGRALVPVLAGIDFRVKLYDNREELAKKEQYPAATEVIFGSYESIRVPLRREDYVIIMTPGHQSDYAILEQVLRFETRYVGCIGSKHKIARTQQLLREAGISEERIQSVHSPIGLPIGAQTPQEIAISIAGELIACRANAL